MDPVEPDAGTLLAGLHDIRLPVEAAGGIVAEIAAAVGLGLLLALCLAPAIRALTRPRARPSAAGIGDRIAALAHLDDQPRREALLRLVAEVRPEFLRTLEPAIYRPGGVPSAEVLEAALRKP